MNLIKKLMLTGTALLALAGCEAIPQTSTEYSRTYFPEEGIVTKKEALRGRAGIQRYLITLKIGDSEVKWRDASKDIYNTVSEGDSVSITFEKSTSTDYHHYNSGYVKKGYSSTNCEVKSIRKK